MIVKGQTKDGQRTKSLGGGGLKWDIIKITVYMYEFIKEQINNNKALL